MYSCLMRCDISNGNKHNLKRANDLAATMRCSDSALYEILGRRWIVPPPLQVSSLRLVELNCLEESLEVSSTETLQEKVEWL